MATPTGIKLLVLIVLTLWAPCRANQAIAKSSDFAVTPAEEVLTQSIDSGALYLQENFTPNGRFVYRRHRDRDVNYGDKYNLLRHAGAMYALADYYQRKSSKDVSEVLVRAAACLHEFIAPVEDAGPDVYAVWTFPDRLGTGSTGGRPYAKLGGSGLGLVALAAVEEIAPGTVPLEDLHNLGQFILFMQTRDGRFFSKYFAALGYDTRWTSLYYPGEACFGLLMLYEIDPDPRWLEAAARGIGYLARTRKWTEDVPADHWALIATDKLLPKLDRLPKPYVERQELIDHARQILEVMLAQQKTTAEDSDVIGSFLDDARTTPTATRLEGMLAALRFLPNDLTDLRSRLERACELGIAFLVRQQIHEGPLKGGMPRAARYLPETEKNDKFNGRVGEVRIDYVQHALSAMMDYQTYLKSAPIEYTMPEKE